MSPKNMRLAEILNGRAAMLGCSLLGLSVIAGKTGLLTNLGTIDMQSLWIAIGVYSS